MYKLYRLFHFQTLSHVAIEWHELF